jgi:integrase
MKQRNKTTRITFKHGAWYYRPRTSEKALFGGKSWYRLDPDRYVALARFAEIMRLGVDNTVGSIIDKYMIECVPKLAPATRSVYKTSLERLSRVLGHNLATAITPHLMYQYRDGLLNAGRSMNVCNADVKIMTSVLDRAVQWGAVPSNLIKGEVKAFGKRDGLVVARTRYVQDWELAEWHKVAKPQQKAFAAIVLLTGSRKGDVLRLLVSDDRGDELRVMNQKGGKEEYYRITPALREAINVALAARKRPSLYLFCDKHGRSLLSDTDQSGAFDKAWNVSMAKAIATTELDNSFTRHDLRKKAASDLDDEERARILLGHTTIQMTRAHYLTKKIVKEPTK